MSATLTIEAIELQAVSIAAHHSVAHNTARSKSSVESSRAAITDDNIRNDVASDPIAAQATAASSGTSMLRIVLTILQPSLINFLSSFCNAIITVGLPVIARSLSLPRALYLWPSSVWGLTSGSMLLIAGSIADLVGPRNVELAGISLMGVFTLACGLSATGVQLVVFRALQGIAMAMHLPASVALVAAGVPQGKARNVGYACLGLSQPFGFSVGLVMGGVMIERIGWRSGFYLSGGAMLVATVAALWMLPKVKPEHQMASGMELLKKLRNKIDWIGGGLASGGLAMLTYVLAWVFLLVMHSPIH
jgi:MFS family permease